MPRDLRWTLHVSKARGLHPAHHPSPPTRRLTNGVREVAVSKLTDILAGAGLDAGRAKEAV